MNKNLDTDLSANDDIILINKDSNVDIDNINLDDVNFDEDDPKTINHVRLIAWCNRYKQGKSLKKSSTKN